MKLALQVLGLGACHFVVTFLLVFAAGVGSKNPFVIIGAKVFSFPLSLVPGGGDGSGDNPALGWGLMIAQSVLWGLGLACLIRRVAGANG